MTASSDRSHPSVDDATAASVDLWVKAYVEGRRDEYAAGVDARRVAQERRLRVAVTMLAVLAFVAGIYALANGSSAPMTVPR